MPRQKIPRCMVEDAEAMMAPDRYVQEVLRFANIPPGREYREPAARMICQNLMDRYRPLIWC